MTEYSLVVYIYSVCVYAYICTYLQIKPLSCPLQTLQKTDDEVSVSGGEADEVAD